MDERRLRTDRSDPGSRALARLEGLRARDWSRRVGSSLALAALAVAAPIAAAPITGDPGATVGAIVGGLLFLALAVAAWPYTWSAEERRHRELEAIWRELRSDADNPVQWERYGAWAEADEGSVDLARIACAPAVDRIRGAPSPYSSQVVRRIDADHVAAAAEAMEELRAEASELELRAQQRYEDEHEQAERLAHEQVLHEIDEAAAAELRAEEERLDRELAQQEATERKAQAEAVAKALRRP